MKGLLISMMREKFGINYDKAFDLYIDFKKQNKLTDLYFLLRKDV